MVFCSNENAMNWQIGHITVFTTKKIVHCPCEMCERRYAYCAQPSPIPFKNKVLRSRHEQTLDIRILLHRLNI